MKKIFYIFASAIVALGAVACQNDIEEGVKPEQQGESVSICVTIDEPTRVALGDFVEGKGYKLSFEEGDQLYVTPTWDGTEGFYFTYTKTEGGNHTFTCDTEGVGAILGTKQTVFFLGCDGEDINGNVVAVSPGGYRCNTKAESIRGIGMVGSTETFGEGTIKLKANPVLKFSADLPVTFTCSSKLFFYHTGWYWGSFTEYTTTTIGEDIYIPLYQPLSNVTFSASINGKVVKSKDGMTFEAGKIYNLGKIEPDKDVANITIDGVFTDWDDVTNNVATCADDATYKAMKTLKAYADAENVYVYVEFDTAAEVRFGLYIDLDNNGSTGETDWKMNNNIGAEFVMSGGSYYNLSNAYPFYWGSLKIYDGANWQSWSQTAVNDVVTFIAPVDTDGVSKAELAISRTYLGTIPTPYIGVGACIWGINTPDGVLPSSGYPLSIPVPAAN
ncbi:MAG: hypothetical protein J6R10_00230 [Tidjanibacter sp.]|nr:hypothetical protein [Tidjanibacter sp.]